MTALSPQLRDGIAAAQAKEFELARTLLEQATAAAPDDTLAWFWLAIASPSGDAAMRCLRRVLQLDASHVQAREELARLLVAQATTTALSGDRAQARGLVTEASRLTPNAEAVWMALAALSDEPTDRINSLRRAYEINPKLQQIRTRFRQALLYRAMLLATSNKPEARSLFREAATLDPNDPRVWQALATLAEGPTDALPALRELVRVAPDHAAGRAVLKRTLAAHAEELAAAGRSEDACKHWREAVALDARDPASWLGLASVTADKGEAQRAIAMAQQIDPSSPHPAALSARLLAREEAAAVRAAPPPPPPPPVRVESPVRPPSPPAAAPVVAPPARPRTERVPAARLAPPAEATPSSSLARRTIMVVDDSPTIRKILGLTLERAGYKVVAEPDGESAVERLQQMLPDLILLDISMPRLDGYEVCKRIKKDPRTAHVPVVMLSGKDAFFDKVKGRMAGAAEYLTKPFETPAVLAVVTTHCLPATEVAHG